MQNMELLVAALEYIENHLGDEINTADVATACFSSKSTIEKLFRCVHNVSVHEYIVRRRMMSAAKKLSSNPQLPIIDVAFECGYSTHESFTRAFQSVWNCKPSEFRNLKFTELFPRLSVPPKEGEEYIMQRKHVDINELYDLFQERKECYFVMTDISYMMKINDISRKAGDLAILEQMRRMTLACGDEDVVFRIGGDEFCILTNSTNESYAAEVAEKIKAMNGKIFEFEDKNIPLTLYVSYAKLGGCERYDEVFAGLHNVIRESKV